MTYHRNACVCYAVADITGAPLDDVVALMGNPPPEWRVGRDRYCPRSGTPSSVGLAALKHYGAIGPNATLGMLRERPTLAQFIKNKAGTWLVMTRTHGFVVRGGHIVDNLTRPKLRSQVVHFVRVDVDAGAPKKLYMRLSMDARFLLRTRAETAHYRGTARYRVKCAMEDTREREWTLRTAAAHGYTRDMLHWDLRRGYVTLVESTNGS